MQTEPQARHPTKKEPSALGLAPRQTWPNAPHRTHLSSTHQPIPQTPLASRKRLGKHHYATATTLELWPPQLHASYNPKEQLPESTSSPVKRRLSIRLYQPQTYMVPELPTSQCGQKVRARGTLREKAFGIFLDMSQTTHRCFPALACTPRPLVKTRHISKGIRAVARKPVYSLELEQFTLLPHELLKSRM